MPRFPNSLLSPSLERVSTVNPKASAKSKKSTGARFPLWRAQRAFQCRGTRCCFSMDREPPQAASPGNPYSNIQATTVLNSNNRGGQERTFYYRTYLNLRGCMLPNDNHAPALCPGKPSKGQALLLPHTFSPFFIWLKLSK